MPRRSGYGRGAARNPTVLRTGSSWNCRYWAEERSLFSFLSLMFYCFLLSAIRVNDSLGGICQPGSRVHAALLQESMGFGFCHTVHVHQDFLCALNQGLVLLTAFPGRPAELPEEQVQHGEEVGAGNGACQLVKILAFAQIQIGGGGHHQQRSQSQEIAATLYSSSGRSLP